MVVLACTVGIAFRLAALFKVKIALREDHMSLLRNRKRNISEEKLKGCTYQKKDEQDNTCCKYTDARNDERGDTYYITSESEEIH